MLTAADRAQLAMALGVMDRPGLATGFPDLVAAMNRLYADRIAKVPWIPPTWLALVQEVQTKNPGDLIIPTPGRDLSGVRGQTAPSFADTDAKLDIWHTIYTDVNSAIVSYAAKFQQQGAAKLANLYASAAFWDAAYKVTKFVADLPTNAAAKAGGWVTDFVLGDIKKNYGRTLILIALAGMGIWYVKNPEGFKRAFGGLLSAAGKRVSGKAAT